MTDGRLVRSLVVALDDLADARTPDYLEAAIEGASSRPQRPAWTFPGRWLPMDLTTQAAPAARLPWRQLGILALIAVLLSLAAAIYIGSRQQSLPPPYGPAANGLVAYAKATDIVVADPVTGSERVIVGGPEVDVAPRFSRDGSRVVFERLAPAPEPGSNVMVVAPDGSGLTRLHERATEALRQPDGHGLHVRARRSDRRDRRGSAGRHARGAHRRVRRQRVALARPVGDGRAARRDPRTSVPAAGRQPAPVDRGPGSAAARSPSRWTSPAAM